MHFCRRYGQLSKRFELHIFRKRPGRHASYGGDVVNVHVCFQTMTDGALIGLARSAGICQPQTQGKVLKMSCGCHGHRRDGHITRSALNHALAVGVNPGKRHGQRCNPIARHGEIVPQCSGRHVRLKTEVTAAARKNLIGLDATGLAMCPPMSFSVK